MKRKDVFIGLLFAMILAIFSFLASSSPDGLERIAEDKNFIEKATSIIKSPIADYLFTGISNEKISGSLAGISGVIVIFILGYGIAKLLCRDNK
jgi:hypothetical protein